ncbi:hypothetical protein [Ramlibacter sp. PS4R-6]|uniref:hypothetical protein n=1 Tax=Ramlibacter sp. PS4R-6 TaxID=3133438 RepID=UPI0030AB8742
MSKSNQAAPAIRVRNPQPASLLREFRMLVSASAVRAPEQLAFAATARAERHMRTARVSWW